MNAFFPQYDPDLALEALRDHYDFAERCPGCHSVPTDAYPIELTVDLWGTNLFRCSTCGHEWVDYYGSHQR